MPKNSSVNEIDRLANAVVKHKELYYSGNPEITDDEYDALEEHLRSLAPNHPVLRMVGTSGKGSTLPKVKHDVPMLSLSKTYKVEDLLSWKGDQDLVASLKIDGNSLSLTYLDGMIHLAKTRGNGKTGEDVTDKVLYVPNIPKTLNISHKIEVRGELCCKKSDFLKLCDAFEKQDLKLPTNPRNVVAGVLGRKEHLYFAKYFTFYAFDVLEGDDHLYEENSLSISAEIEKTNFFDSHGFLVPSVKKVKTKDDIESYLEFSKTFMEEGDVAVDGAVFTINSLESQKELGFTSHHPRYRLSFKWQGQSRSTTIQDIVWQTSRSGIVTPVAKVDPVDLSGATISNVTLHNAAHVKDYNLKPGDVISIIRSGEVIPKFLEVIKPKHGEYSFPSGCPECRGKLEFDDVRLRCTNDNCPAKVLHSILQWIRSVEIDDLSEKRLTQMIEAGLVETIVDLYRLDQKDLLKLPLTKEKMAKKVYTNIQKSRNTELSSFLTGLGFPGVGKTTWESLIAELGDLNKIRNATVDEILSLHGFAEKSAQQIVQSFEEKKELIDELLKVGFTFENSISSPKSSEISGKTFVITGALSKPRKDIESLLKAHGAKASGSVSKNTFALICNESDSNSSKYKKAIELNIPVWSEEKLYQVLV